MIVLCPMCGTELPNEATYCEKCGADPITGKCPANPSSDPIPETAGDLPRNNDKKKRDPMWTFCLYVLLFFLIAAVFKGCMPVVVPNVSGTDSETAKAVMLEHGLIPQFEEVANNSEDRSGLVNATSPNAGSLARRNKQITIFVYERYEALHSGALRVSNDAPVSTNYWNVYVQGDMLYVDVSLDVDENFTWKEWNDTNTLYVEVSQDAEFYNNFTSVIQAEYDDQSYKVGEVCDLVFEIPLSVFGDTLPNHVYLCLETETHGEIKLEFNLTW